MTDDLIVHAEAALARRLDPDVLRRAPASVSAVTHRGRIIAVASHGEPRRDGATTTPGTVFRIASMSKSFLAATTLALRDEGVLDLHARVASYVPELAAARLAGKPVGDRITLAALLSNSAGLAEDNPWGDEHLGESRAFITDILRDGLTLSAPPGTEYQYSNLGQSLVGRAIEAVTGASVEDAVRDRLLAPLGLSDTNSSAELYPEGADLAHGFRTFDDGGSFTLEPYVGTGALGCIGSLFGTVRDIAVWMHFLGSAFDADHQEGAALSASSRREMQVARTLIAPAPCRGADRILDGAGYGYGLIVEHDRRFGRIVQHTGGLPGFSSHMRWHPASGVGVVVLGNSDAFGAARIAEALLDDTLIGVDAPAAIVEPWPETIAAAQHIDELLRTGRAMNDPDAWARAAPLARNVLRDVPAAVRTRQLGIAVAEVGDPKADAPPFASRVVRAPDPSALRWTVPCASGTLVCDVRLVGLSVPIVQSLDVRAAGPDGRKPKDEAAEVTDHYRVAFVHER